MSLPLCNSKLPFFLNKYITVIFFFKMKKILSNSRVLLLVLLYELSFIISGKYEIFEDNSS